MEGAPRKLAGSDLRCVLKFWPASMLELTAILLHPHACGLDADTDHPGKQSHDRMRPCIPRRRGRFVRPLPRYRSDFSIALIVGYGPPGLLERLPPWSWVSKSTACRWHWRSLIEEPNVAWPEIELSRLVLGQVLIRQFGYRIGRNALPDLCDHLRNRNRRHPALSPPDARERNHNDRSAAYCRFSHHISMA